MNCTKCGKEIQEDDNFCIGCGTAVEKSENSETVKSIISAVGINGAKILNVTQMNDDVWLTQNQMAELFDVDNRTISYHIGNIFKDGELEEKSTVQEIWTVQNEGGRDVSRNITHYNLDAIISVGYRVNSKRGIQFRRQIGKVINL